MKKEKKQYEKMTETPIPKLIVSLSVPTIISMLVTNIYNMADTMFVGRLGNSASGAVGVVFGFMAILQAIGFMFGQGAGSLVSRLLGRKDVESAGRIASTGFFYALGFGIILEAIGFFFLDSLVKLLGSTDTIAPYAKTYIVFILFAAPFMVPSFVLNNLLRYEGKALLGMIGLLAGAVLNMAADPLLMFGLNMGIAGAGLSTALSQIVSFFILLSVFLKGKTQCRLSIRMVSRNFREVGNLCATGLPSLLRQGLSSLTTMLLNYEAAIYGDAAVAAMSIVTRISMFIFSFAIGIGQGFQPVSGFNYGAGKYRRLRQAFWFTAILSEFLILVIGVSVFLVSDDLIQKFRDDPLVIEIGTRALRLQCASMPFLPVCMVTEMMFQSTGHKIGASIMSSLRSGIFFIPCLVVLAFIRGLAGIQEAQPLAYILAFFPSVCFVVYFFRHLPKEDAAA